MSRLFTVVPLSLEMRPMRQSPGHRRLE